MCRATSDDMSMRIDAKTVLIGAISEEVSAPKASAHSHDRLLFRAKGVLWASIQYYVSI